MDVAGRKFFYVPNLLGNSATAKYVHFLQSYHSYFLEP